MTLNIYIFVLLFGDNSKCIGHCHSLMTVFHLTSQIQCSVISCFATHLQSRNIFHLPAKNNIKTLISIHTVYILSWLSWSHKKKVNIKWTWIKWNARLNNSQNGVVTKLQIEQQSNLKNSFTVILRWNSNDVKSRTFNSWFIFTNSFIYLWIWKIILWKVFYNINPVGCKFI